MLDGKDQRHRPGQRRCACPARALEFDVHAERRPHALAAAWRRASARPAPAARRGLARALRPGLDDRAGRRRGGAGRLPDRAPADQAARSACSAACSAGARATCRRASPKTGRTRWPILPIASTRRRRASRTLVRSHKSLLANASHELRSPLTRIRMGAGTDGRAAQRRRARRDLAQHRRARPADRRDPAGEPARRQGSRHGHRRKRST